MYINRVKFIERLCNYVVFNRKSKEYIFKYLCFYRIRKNDLISNKII